MLIAVLSDTHKEISILDRLMQRLEQADLIIHLGDVVKDAEYIEKRLGKELIYVKGNCDFTPIIPSERLEVILGKKFFITHGHNYNVKSNIINLSYKAEEVGANIALYGHTHVPSIEKINNIWYINPGSTSFSREGRNTYATIEILEDEIKASIRNIRENDI